MSTDEIRSLLLESADGALDDTQSSPPADGENADDNSLQIPQEEPEANDTDGRATEEPVEGAEGEEDVEEEEPAKDDLPDDTDDEDKEDSDDDDDNDDDAILSVRARERIETSRKQVREAREEAEKAKRDAESINAVLTYMHNNPKLTFEQAVNNLLYPQQESQAKAAPVAQEASKNLDNFIEEVASEDAFAGEDADFIHEIAQRRYAEHELRQQVAQTQQAVQAIVGHYQQMVHAAQQQQTAAIQEENDAWAASQIKLGIDNSKGALLSDETEALKDDAYRRFFNSYDAMSDAEKVATDERQLMQQCIKDAIDNGIRLYQRKRAIQQPNAGKTKKSPRYESTGGTPPQIADETPKDFDDLRTALWSAVTSSDGRA